MIGMNRNYGNKRWNIFYGNKWDKWDLLIMVEENGNEWE